ncbi:MAG: hypothetical protein R3C10_14770 [Pirellulales bacterium]|nr:hypothetical protein [Planctomycetales bacterium]
MQPDEHQEHRQRDAVSMFMLGSFFLVMGTLVMIGSAWANQRPHALVVNIVAALVLLAVGGGMVAMGWYYKTSAAPGSGQSPPPRGDE